MVKLENGSHYKASSPNKKMMYFLIIDKPILIRSRLTAGIVQDTFAGESGEGEGGEEEMTGDTFTATSTGTFTAQARKSSFS